MPCLPAPGPPALTGTAMRGDGPAHERPFVAETDHGRIVHTAEDPDGESDTVSETLDTPVELLFFAQGETS